MRIKRFENSVFGSNSYVIDDGLNAVIFDIGDTPPIIEYLQTVTMPELLHLVAMQRH